MKNQEIKVAFLLGKSLDLEPHNDILDLQNILNESDQLIVSVFACHGKNILGHTHSKVTNERPFNFLISDSIYLFLQHRSKYDMFRLTPV